ncbi:chorismate mutase [Marinobacter halodurans]|uniref:chorismate mutase n=1 Tax=Marinobacter halodurans TaxID=2528979 RepID=UPI0013F1768E|nr:chorismate mutase [Marinobacter halodurans]
MNHDELLQDLRGSLDSIDNEICEGISRRLKIIKEIGEVKKEHNIPIMQNHRVDFVLDKAKSFGEMHNVNPQFLVRVFELFIEEACKIEDKVIEQEE